MTKKKHSAQSLHQQEDKHIKVMVVGTASVGKSCIVKQFLRKPLDIEYKPTKQDVYTKTIELDRETYQVEIYDTAGFFEMPSYRDALYKCADGFLLVFSIIDLDSFMDLEFLRKRILLNRPDASMVLVGNKKDLSHKRDVKAQEGLEKEAQWGIQYFESSALYNDNVTPIFKHIVSEVTRKRKAELLATSSTKKDCVLM